MTYGYLHYGKFGQHFLQIFEILKTSSQFNRFFQWLQKDTQWVLHVLSRKAASEVCDIWAGLDANDMRWPEIQISMRSEGFSNFSQILQNEEHYQLYKSFRY